VACACGAKLTLDARGFGKSRPCPSCKASVTVAWGRDPNTRKTVPIAMTQAPRPKPGAPKAAPSVAASAAAAVAVPGKIQKFEKPKPSAPLVPLHMRPPLRVRLKPGAQFFDCPCGERLMMRKGAAEGRAIQCPACDRFHLIEIQGGAAAEEAPAAAAVAPAAPGLPPPTRPLKLGEFVCKCGEIQPPRTSRTGRKFTCAKCGREGTVDAVTDPATKAVTMKATFTKEPENAAPPPSSRPEWTCVCGRPLEAREVLAKTEVPCPGCGRIVKLEKSKRVNLTVIKPIFTDAVPAPPPPPPPKSKPKSKEPTVVFEELPLDQPPAIESDAEVVPCGCSAELLISRAHVGQSVQCPACSDLLLVELEGRQLRLRVQGAAAEPEDWQLDEFK
jgi:predicted RNA-binding Zn-ribbon protein involved in translation (DUF1610 family)